MLNTGFFFIRVAVADNHSANENVFNILLDKFKEVESATKQVPILPNKKIVFWLYIY